MFQYFYCWIWTGRWQLGYLPLHYFAYNLSFSPNIHLQNWCFNFRTSLTEEFSDAVTYSDYKSQDCKKSKQTRLTYSIFQKSIKCCEKIRPIYIADNQAFYHKLCWLNPKKYKYSKNLWGNYHNNISAFLLTLRKQFSYLFLNLVINT